MTDSTLTSNPRRIHPVLRQPRSSGRDPILRDRGPLALRSIHGQVARFSGVVDRFGGQVKLGTIVPTLCIGSLRHTASGRVVGEGPLRYDINKPIGSIDWLRANSSQYSYQRNRISGITAMNLGGTPPSITVTVDEQSTLQGPKASRSSIS